MNTTSHQSKVAKATLAFCLLITTVAGLLWTAQSNAINTTSLPAHVQSKPLVLRPESVAALPAAQT